MQNNDNFMDRKTLTAIVLVGAVWFGWQSYLSKKYPTQNLQTQKVEVETKPVMPQNNQIVASPAAIPKTEPSVTEVLESNIEVGNDFSNFVISNKGLGIKNLSLNKFKDNSGNLINFTPNEKGLFPLFLNGQVVHFNKVTNENGLVTAEANFDGVKIIRNLKITADKYAFENTISIEGDLKNKTLSVGLSDTKKEFSGGHFLFPSYEFQEFFIQHEDEKVERINITHAKDPIDSIFKIGKMGSIDSHYFTAGMVDKSDVIPDVKVLSKDQAIGMSFDYALSQGASSATIKFISYVGPRDLDILESVDPSLGKLVNFGFFEVIAKPLLTIMKWFYSIAGNWGIAIILLTLFVRLIVMPLHIMSFRSMKSMQKVQPFITALREKYKDDPTTLNKEMMDLMRTHKVNPLGGCLPMLLQIPVFFALYQVFGQSIDLYHAPFGLWIHDLSQKDPYYVLPVLMAVVMYFQQKLTPTTMDPTQAKVMAFMPVIFSVFMLSLPSSLTLYMFVSTLFGVIQQVIILKEKSPSISIKEAKA